jgi:hypothetical protein
VCEKENKKNFKGTQARDWMKHKKPNDLRIHRGISERSDISYSAAQTRVYQRLSFTLQRSNAYSISLQSTAATHSS